MAAGEVDIARRDDLITVVSPDRRRHVQPGRRGVVAARARRRERPGALGRAGDGGVAVPHRRARVGHQLALGEDRPRARAGAPARDRGPLGRAGAHVSSPPQHAGPQPGPPTVRFVDGASSNATVIEVHAATNVGILHRITKALGELGLDIRHATVQTIGMEVVDTFYVRTSAGDWSPTRSTARRSPGAAARRRPSDCRPVSEAPSVECSVTAMHATWRDGASRSPPSPGPGWGSPRTCTSASGTKRCCTSPPTSRPRRASSTRPSTSGVAVERETDHFVQEWMTSIGEGVPGYVTPKVAIGAIVGNDTARSCSSSARTRESGSTRPGGPTSATRRPRWRSRR